MLRETSAASTIAASTATGAPAAPTRRASATKNATATAAPSARPIRKPRIQASSAPPISSIRAPEARRKGRERSLRYEARIRRRALSFGGRHFELREKAREEVQIKDDPKRVAALSGASTTGPWRETLRRPMTHP